MGTFAQASLGLIAIIAMIVGLVGTGFGQISTAQAATSGSVTLTPVLDTYLSKRYPDRSYSSSTLLRGTATGNNAFLRFNTAGQLPEDARVTGLQLRGYVTRNEVSSGGFQVYQTGTTWSNSSTWNNSTAELAAFDAAPLRTTAYARAGSWFVADELPASLVGSSGDVNLGFKYNVSGSSTRVASRENSSNQPELIVSWTTDAPPPPPPATTGSVTLKPTLDTYVNKSNPNRSYGSSTLLRGTATGNNAFLRFSTAGQLPAGAAVTGVRLKGYVTRNDASNGGFEVYQTGTSWSGSSTWNNSTAELAAFGGTPVVVTLRPAAGTWFDTGVLPRTLVDTNGDVNLGFKYNVSGSSTRVASRENSSNQPELIVSWTTTPSAYPVLMAAGDISCAAGPSGSNCQQGATSNLVLAEMPNDVLILGDSQYEGGEYSNFRTYYDPTWGRFRGISHFAVGNHEYRTNFAKGMFDYVNGPGQSDGRAGERGKGHFAYLLGDWKIIVLNSECNTGRDTSAGIGSKSVIGGCGVGSPQYNALKEYLTTNPTTCTAVAMHRSRFTTVGNHTSNYRLGAMWNLMVEHGVDVALSGHSHVFEQYEPIGKTGTTSSTAETLMPDPAGITAFVVGSGGKEINKVFAADGTRPAVEAALKARSNSAHGVMKMVLKPTGYDWEMVPVPGYTFVNHNNLTDGAFSGSASCN